MIISWWKKILKFLQFLLAQGNKNHDAEYVSHWSFFRTWNLKMVGMFFEILNFFHILKYLLWHSNVSGVDTHVIWISWYRRYERKLNSFYFQGRKQIAIILHPNFHIKLCAKTTKECLHVRSTCSQIISAHKLLNLGPEMYIF